MKVKEKIINYTTINDIVRNIITNKINLLHVVGALLVDELKYLRDEIAENQVSVLQDIQKLNEEEVHVLFLKLIVKEKQDPNIRDEYTTLLNDSIIAYINKKLNLATIELMLEYKADPNLHIVENEEDDTPFHNAIKTTIPEIISLFKEYSRDISTPWEYAKHVLTDIDDPKEREILKILGGPNLENQKHEIKEFILAGNLNKIKELTNDNAHIFSEELFNIYLIKELLKNKEIESSMKGEILKFIFKKGADLSLEDNNEMAFDKVGETKFMNFINFLVDTANRKEYIVTMDDSFNTVVSLILKNCDYDDLPITQVLSGENDDPF